MKIVLDTNILVSYVLSSSRTPKDIMEMVFSGAVDLILSAEIVEEFEKTLKKPRLQKFIKISRSECLLADLPILVNTPIIVDVDMVRDFDDNKIVATAISGRAEYIVTQDNDLLDLDEHHKSDLKEQYGISIVTAYQFMTELKQRGLYE